MSEPFLGQIQLVAFNFAPTGWALCDGQTLPISQNTALFSLLGTYYGGNGTSNFQLPNLQGLAALHAGQGVGLSQYEIGETINNPTVTLNQQDVPAHTHTIPASTLAGTSTKPSPTEYPATVARGEAKLYNTTGAGSMAAGELSTVGGSQPHNNLMPYLVLNYVIALQGIYPSRS